MIRWRWWIVKIEIDPDSHIVALWNNKMARAQNYKYYVVTVLQKFTKYHTVRLRSIKTLQTTTKYYTVKYESYAT